jgi:aspartate/methionine/tyrosine aminotransferase
MREAVRRHGEVFDQASPRLFAAYGAAGPAAWRPDLQILRGRDVASGAAPPPTLLTSGPDDRLREVYRRVSNPDDPIELRDLFLGRVEAGLDGRGARQELAARWRDRRVLRDVDDDMILRSRATPRFIKELFNWFFRDDLYGDLRSDRHLLLSSGSVDETRYGLPPVLKSCIAYALDRDWYGYSDSRGRVPAREAIALLENERLSGAPYGPERVAISLGGTFALSAVADFVLGNSTSAAPALCPLPNYPPLVEAVARRHDVELVPLACAGGVTSLAPLLAALRPDTPLVLLQTVTNPTGTAVPEAELEALVAAAGPDTAIVLDECHECLGEHRQLSACRADPRVIRISSLSKSLSVPGLKVGWLLGSADFVEEFYEYASTTYGGPPSFYYTLVEVVARFERFVLRGGDPGPEQLAEFDPGYGITPAALAPAVREYRDHRRWRHETLVGLRDYASCALRALGAEVVTAGHSMNVTARLPTHADDGYLTFRRLLEDAETAVLPGVLTYCLGSGWIRITTARDPALLAESLRRIERFVDKGGTR